MQSSTLFSQTSRGSSLASHENAILPKTHFEKIADEIVSTLSEGSKWDTVVLDEWMTEEIRDSKSLANEIVKAILGWLPREHKKMMILVKTCLVEIDLETLMESWISSDALFEHLFRHMTQWSCYDNIELYPYVHHSACNERFLCWNLEMPRKSNVAWYVVDMLAGFTVRRIERGPSRSFLVNEECCFMGRDKLFIAKAHMKTARGTIQVIDLLSGLTREVGEIRLDEEEPRTFVYAPGIDLYGNSIQVRCELDMSLLCFANLHMACIPMTKNRVWIVKYRSHPKANILEWKGNGIFDTQRECVVGSIDNEKLLNKNINPKCASFFMEDLGFIFMHSLLDMTLVKMNGDIVKLRCVCRGDDEPVNMELEGLLPTKWAVVKVNFFDEDMFVFASGGGVSSVVTGSVATYLIWKCDMNDFVDSCHEALDDGAPLDADGVKSCEFVWPRFSTTVTTFGGTFHVC